MKNNYWIKLYSEILTDPKIGRLSDSSFRRFVELLLLASEQEGRDGFLPCLCDVAWQLRVSEEQIESDWGELERAGIVEMRDGMPFVINFSKRQKAIGAKERQKQYRARKRGESNGQVTPKTAKRNESVTTRNADRDKDKDIREEEERAHAQPSLNSPTKPKEQPLPQHLQGFNAMYDEQRTPAQLEMEQELSFLVRDSASIDKIIEVAGILVDKNITPAQVRAWFGHDAVYWYQVGHGKKDMMPPYANNIKSDIGGAMAWQKRGGKTKVPASTTTPAQNQLLAGYRRPGTTL